MNANEYKTWGEWEAEGRAINKGEKMKGRNGEGKAVFHVTQTVPISRDPHASEDWEDDCFSFEDTQRAGMGLGDVDPIPY